MNEIRLKNYRCFRDAQTVRLAPLTLLVGENSTGKTSFLALARALADLEKGRVPDFKASPYDLGSFHEIAHRRGNAGEPALSFEAGFSSAYPISSTNVHYDFDARFEERGTGPFPVMKRLGNKSVWIEERLGTDQTYTVCAGTSRGVWEWDIGEIAIQHVDIEEDYLNSLTFRMMTSGFLGKTIRGKPLNGSPEVSSEDLGKLDLLPLLRRAPRPFASAPIRSKPRRTYDPARVTQDSEGNYVPMYLAEMLMGDKGKWKALKSRLERFGKSSGLFDEISVNRLGGRGGPFQLQFRKYAGEKRGPRHNLIDVGYGVSQALPLLTELLREDASDLFLLQQPEIHLHPRAQAELGSLFCQLASSERQFIVETHSDHLMNRVRMDIRDQVSPLTPEDVSLLYFERKGLDVQIHSIEFDEDGNVVGAPDSYRSFFMEESKRTIWRRYAPEKV